MSVAIDNTFTTVNNTFITPPLSYNIDGLLSGFKKSPKSCGFNGTTAVPHTPNKGQKRSRDQFEFSSVNKSNNNSSNVSANNSNNNGVNSYFTVTNAQGIQVNVADQSLDKIVGEKRSSFIAMKSEVPLMKEKIEQIRGKIIAYGTSRVTIRKRLDLAKKMKELQTEIDKILSGEDEKKYEELVERYLQAYHWNLIQERDIGKKRKIDPDTGNNNCGISQQQQSELSNKFTTITSSCIGTSVVGQENFWNLYSAINNSDSALSNTTSGSNGGTVGTTNNKLIGGLVQTSTNSVATVRKNLKSQNKLIIREYLSEVEGCAPPIHITHQDMCETCNQPLLLSVNNSLLTCPICKTGHPYMDATTASMSYGEEVEFSSFTYKKVHHFEDWLKKFQAKGSKKVQKKVIYEVMDWLYLHGYTQKSMIKKEHVRLALKDKNLKKYYDHDMQIYCRITNKPAPCMTPEQEELCRIMFTAIQAPFDKWVAIIDPNRRNFLSYSYCLYKFCQLLGWKEFLQYFTLLKGREKLKKQDEIWKKICQSMMWEFIPSI